MRETGIFASRKSARRAARPSRSATGGTIRTLRPLRSSARNRSARTVLRRSRIPRRRSRSAPESARSETPPSGAGDTAASAPSSTARNALERAEAEGATSPPTRTECPPSAAARRAASSRRRPKVPPRCLIQAVSGAPRKTCRHAAMSSGGVATTSCAPVCRAASSQPAVNPRKTSAASDPSPFSRA